MSRHRRKHRSGPPATVRVQFQPDGGGDGGGGGGGDDGGDDGGESSGVCAIDLPTHVGAIRVAAVGGSFLSGLRGALSIASSIASNPILASVLPPGTGAALNAVSKIGIAHSQGGPVAAKAAAAQFSGPGGARLQKALAENERPSAPYRGGGYYYGLPA